jgi:hypothetical protein
MHTTRIALAAVLALSAAADPYTPTVNIFDDGNCDESGDWHSKKISLGPCIDLGQPGAFSVDTLNSAIKCSFYGDHKCQKPCTGYLLRSYSCVRHNVQQDKINRLTNFVAALVRSLEGLYRRVHVVQFVFLAGVTDQRQVAGMEQ